MCKIAKYKQDSDKQLTSEDTFAIGNVVLFKVEAICFLCCVITAGKEFAVSVMNGGSE